MAILILHIVGIPVSGTVDAAVLLAMLSLPIDACGVVRHFW